MKVLDIRGHVDTREVAPGVEKSTYVPEYDAYLKAHIPVSILIYLVLSAACYRHYIVDSWLISLPGS